MKNLSKVTALALLISVSGGVVSTSAVAAPNYAEIEKRKNAKTKVMGERVGKKVVKAFELYEAEDVDGAIAILKELDPSDKFDKATVDRYLGQLYAQKDNYQLAIKHIRDAVKPDVLNFNDQEQAMKLIGDLLANTKKYKEAKQAYIDWMDFTGEEDATVYTRIAQANYELGQFKDVVQPAERAIELNAKSEPKKAPFSLLMGAYYETKDFPNVVKVGERMVKSWPEDKKSWTNLGRFYMQVEDYSKGLNIMDIAYDNGYLESETDYKVLAQLYSFVGVPYKAGFHMEKAVNEGKVERTKPNVTAIASYYHNTKNIKTAAKYYEEAAKFDNDAELFRKAGSLRLQEQQFDKAVALLNKALDLGSDKKGQIYSDLAEAYLQQEKYKQAYAAISKAAEDPSTRKFARSWKTFIKDKAQRNGVSL
ncbi:tetratricopeptide repeat protein [Pseudoalteromonas sp. T1lg75]|uniref:tetratricopeptide repeat protein n=1 Tax=Pseudoalteromonas sp. T1lg75 TaxID=2077102 RepID=UPI000CF60772|nr:tetratricopeptide repeat protein [Pseudoalteromonas sp. T1lg75]